MENVLPQIHKLRGTRCRIACPVNECGSTFDVVEAFERMEQRERSRFLGIVRDITLVESTMLKQLQLTLLELMTLKCPTCKNTVDPFPDACSAVMCLFCGNHYCNYCFMAFATGDSQQDRARAHTHVAIHNSDKPAQSRDAFLSNALTREGQRNYLFGILRKCLTLAFGARELTAHEVGLALVLVDAELVDLGISSLQLWQVVRDQAREERPSKTSFSSLPSSSSAAVAAVSAPAHPAGSAAAASDLSLVKDVPKHSEGRMRASLAAAAPAFVPGSPRRDTASAGAAGQSKSGKASPNRKRGSSNDPASGSKVKKGGDEEHGTGGEYVARGAGSNSGAGAGAGGIKQHATRTSGAPNSPRLRQAAQGSAQMPRGGGLVSTPAQTQGQRSGASSPFRSVAASALVGSGSDSHRLSGPLEASSAESIPMASTPVPPLKQGGVQIANAILTENGFAIQQILQTIRGPVLDVDYIDQKHGHPLATLAILAGQPHVAAELIRCGADPLVCNTGGRNVMYIATESGCIDVVRTILQVCPEFDLNAPATDEPQRYHPLHVAARYNHGHLIRLFHEYGAGLDPEEGEHGYTPLTLALVLGHKWAASELINLGCSLRAHSMNGRTSMFVAAEKGLTEVLSQVLKTRTFDINEPVVRPSGLRLLHVACFHNKFNVVSMLIECGADLDVLDDEGGYTPLAMALIGHNPTSALELIDAGANCHLASLNGRTPLYVAVEKGMAELVVKLVTHARIDINSPTAVESTGSRPLHLALLHSQVHLVPTLLRLGADVNQVDSEKRCTPFLMACIMEDEWTVKRFLPMRPNLMTRTNEGRSALYIAVEKGSPALIRLLHQAHVAEGREDEISSPCTTEAHGGTPLHIAAMFNMPIAAQVLLELGANINARDARGRTAMDVAHEASNTNVFLVLEEAATQHTGNAAGHVDTPSGDEESADVDGDADGDDYAEDEGGGEVEADNDEDGDDDNGGGEGGGGERYASS